MRCAKNWQLNLEALSKLSEGANVELTGLRAFAESLSNDRLGVMANTESKMGKAKHGFICIGWWQTETVIHNDQTFTFSPFGIGRIDGWILMDWQRTEVCDIGHKHAVERWHNHPSLAPRKKEPPVPHIPREVWRKLKRKTKDVEKAPWPGRD